MKLLFLLGLLTGVASLAANPDAVVALDGSGDFTSVQAAISAAPMRTGPTDPPWEILVKPGTYHERVYVQRERGNIRVRGEDARRTIITADFHAKQLGLDGQPIGTFRTPTVQVDGDGMTWENITIVNSAGPVAQALALRADGDRLSFKHCRFLGWQDTMLLNRGRHYFADCYIEGGVDFIFGGATAYFERCQLHCVGDGYITAASTPAGQPYGFVFADCRITGAPGVRAYLGRPWRDFAHTVFLRTTMTEVVRPAGWHNWHKPSAEKTTYYAEIANLGPGAIRTDRVAWAQSPGTGDSARYTARAVLAGADGWDPLDGPTLHFAGDSTMADKLDSAFPERGWGQLFRELVRPPWRFVNHAANGRSTTSFRALGHWQRLLDQVAAGDCVLIEFGHNDEKQSDPTRYADPARDYPDNLRRCVHEVRARGASPVLATPVARRKWDAAGQLVDTHGVYLDAVRRVAAEEKVPLLDLAALTRARLLQLGPTGSRALFMNFAPGELPSLPEGRVDNTHYNATGARMVAHLAAAEMRRLQLPFADSLRDAPPTPWSPDLGDGRYRNPVLYADYSDPDAIRVGDDYWLTASSFSHVPGLPLLHSRDLVNWELVGHALPRLTPAAVYREPQPGKGVWAPAIRHHGGKYWIYYPDPDFGIYALTADDPRGPWSEPVLVAPGRGLIDPCPFWDAEGRVWLIHAWAKSRAGFNNRLTLLRLNSDGLSVAEDCGVVIDGDQLPGCTTLEGPKLYQRNGWYYLFAPAGGVTQGWQYVFRSRDLRGPYDVRNVLAQGDTPINGPHQGALVDTPQGDWWFLHFQDQGAYGRVVHLEPVAWRDDWPLVGTGVASGAVTGHPVLVHAKPALPASPMLAPATTDEFDGPRLAPPWQWQANPDPAWFSLNRAPGFLRLHAQPLPAAGNLRLAPNLLLQKFPAPTFTATTTVEFSPRANGDHTGLIVFGDDYAWIGVRQRDGQRELVVATCATATQGHAERVTSLAAVPAGAEVRLRVTVATGARCEFAYSLDGAEFVPTGVAFTATPGRWVGAKVGLFASGAADACADFDWLRFAPLSARR